MFTFFLFMAKRQSVDSDITGLQEAGAAIFSFNSLNRLNHTILKNHTNVTQ